MKAEGVRYWLEVHSKCRLKGDEGEVDAESFEWCMKDIDIVRFCDEIAAAHEAELATAQAQVAVITDAWNAMEIDLTALDGLDDEDGLKIAVLADELRNFLAMLSAAPKVVDSEQAKWDTAWLVWPVVRLKRPLAPYAIDGDDVVPGVTFMGHGPERYEKFPGKKARVIVVLDEAEGEPVQSKSVKRRLVIQKGEGE